MIIRLGYACSIESVEKLTTSSTYTYTNFIKENNFDKLSSIVISNLEALEQIIIYNIKNNIHFYRLSSKLIPLATKEDVVFDYIKKYNCYYDRIGNLIKDNNMRVDFHPDQFCVLNSIKEDIVLNTIESLKYHYSILEALKIPDKILILHVGSNVFGKEKSLERFIKNFNKLPIYIKNVIALENDDKIFNIHDLLYLSEKLNVPVVLDYHHHICNHIENDDIFKYIDNIFKTWKGKTPKIHFSSPKSKIKKEIRSHHDYIDVNSFIDFLVKLKTNSSINNLDIMIEAKKKDEALFRLVRNLKYKTDYKFIDDTSFYI